MTNTCGLDPWIEIRLGRRHRVLTLQDLAAPLGVALPELRGVLLGFLLRSPAGPAAALACRSVTTTPSGTEGEQEGEVGNETNDETKTRPASLSKTRTTNETNESREELGAKEGARDLRIETIASYLAEVLHDPAGVSTYERLASQYPAEHLKRVLALVLRVPADRIRQSRGAYFTALVGRL